MKKSKTPTAGASSAPRTCSSCIHFHREEKRWITWDWIICTTGRWFKTEHGKPVKTHHFELVEECRRFPHFEPRKQFDTCGEHTSNSVFIPTSGSSNPAGAR